MNDLNAFLNHLSTENLEKAIIKLSLSKCRNKHAEINNTYIRPILIRNQYQYQVSRRSNTQDFVENISENQLIQEVDTLLKNHFFNAHLQTTTAEYTIIQNKKGNSKLTVRKMQKKAPILDHNRSKKRFVDPNALYLKSLGICTSHGKIKNTHQKKYKQIDKYIELLDGLIKTESISSIVDMGCGKGYLTFALYDYLHKNSSKEVQITGVEARDGLVDLCNKIAQESAYTGLLFKQGNIEQIKLEKTDMVIALHACDIATDMAIAKGIEVGAKFIVVAPCCHKQIRKAMDIQHASLKTILGHGILLERYAEMITDGIRALILEHYGYRTKVFEFISSEHTGKNLMITAEYTGSKNTSAKSEIESIKTEYKIDKHYLETLCPIHTI